MQHACSLQHFIDWKGILSKTSCFKSNLTQEKKEKVVSDDEDVVEEPTENLDDANAMSKCS